MASEDVGLFDDPPARAVSVSWVWPGRWLLEIGGDVAVVITGAELGLLVDEVNREAGRIGDGV